jgi:phosphatidylserine/phosphatidylglycerophosphate/cardiolipin synthase-like enzyme
VTGEDLGAAVRPAQVEAGVPVQIVRTIPEKVYEFLPQGDFRILETYIRALRSACSLIYLENQFLWSPEIVAVLEQKLREPPTDEFRIVVMLPRNPNNGRDETRGQVGRLITADGGAGRFLAVTTRQRSGSVTGPVYVHAKVGIVDDRWLTIGSANLNEHSLFNDSEMNVVVCDELLARQTRLRLWSEHLERPVPELAGSPGKVVDEVWRPIAEREHERAAAGLPAQARLLALPGVSRRTNALLGPLQGFVVDG